jgi:dUTP pyrophosphatase
MEIKIINKSDNALPKYESEQAAGMDLRAYINEPITLEQSKITIVPTGIYIKIPVGYEAQIRPRSGLAANHGVTVLNTPGTIDSDYLGEIKIILINLGDAPFIIRNNDRIAQMVFSKHEIVEMCQVDVFNEKTKRNENGFGHTGIK